MLQLWRSLLESEEYDIIIYNLGVAEQVHNVCLEERDAICTHMANHFAIFQVKCQRSLHSQYIYVIFDMFLLFPSLREVIVENRKKL